MFAFVLLITSFKEGYEDYQRAMYVEYSIFHSHFFNILP